MLDDILSFYDQTNEQLQNLYRNVAHGKIT